MGDRGVGVGDRPSSNSGAKAQSHQVAQVPGVPLLLCSMRMAPLALGDASAEEALAGVTGC